jgi:threonine/homoserine/homoserine lactone efflux protein
VSVLGLSVGALVHVAAATAGLSAILLTSANAFAIVKALGAGYLVYLGIRTLLTRQPTGGIGELQPVTLYRLFADGIVVSVLNPKIAVFFLAFLPQFVVPTKGSVPNQVLILGLLYVALALVTDSSYAVLAGYFRRVLGNRVIQGPLPRYGTGCVYLGLGVGTALADRQ